MSTDVQGQVAVVTGGGSGIGRALVETLTAGGASVLAVDVNQDALTAVSDSTGCETRVADVRSVAENEAIMAQALGSFGRLDMVFLNAGILGRNHREPQYRAADIDLDRYDMVRAVNTDGVVYGSVEAAKVMAETGGGAIVATASVAGLLGYAPTPMYSLSKAAVIGWVRAVAEAFATDGVRINAICPTFTVTGLFQPDMIDTIKEGLSDKLKKTIPMQRFGDMQEIADAILWLCSDQASFVNGLALPIDGGQTA